MIFHPYYGGDTIHRPEDVDILYSSKPVVADYWETTGRGFWQLPIDAPDSTKAKTMRLEKKLALAERLLLSKLPTVSAAHLTTAKEVAHNVYKLPSIEEGIRWMHAA